MVEVPFWFRFSNWKLEKLKLDQEIISLHASIELSQIKASSSAASCRLTLSADAIESQMPLLNSDLAHKSLFIPLRLKNFNLMEDFKTLKKKQILEEEAKLVYFILTTDYKDCTRRLFHSGSKVPLLFIAASIFRSEEAQVLLLFCESRSVSLERNQNQGKKKFE